MEVQPEVLQLDLKDRDSVWSEAKDCDLKRCITVLVGHGGKEIPRD